MYIVFYRGWGRDNVYIATSTHDKQEGIKRAQIEPDKWEYSQIYHFDVPADAFAPKTQQLPDLKPIDDAVGKIAAAIEQGER